MIYFPRCVSIVCSTINSNSERFLENIFLISVQVLLPVIDVEIVEAVMTDTLRGNNLLGILDVVQVHIICSLAIRLYILSRL